MQKDEMTTYTPFTYLIGWSRHNIWYYGVRVKAGTTPADLWTLYFTSSKLVSRMRAEIGEPDVIQVRRTFQSKREALMWEHKVLRRMHIKMQPMWLNISLGLGDNHHVGPHSAASIRKMSQSHQHNIALGIRSFKHSEEHIQKLRAYNPGGRATARSIHQIDPASGHTLNTWMSTREAGLTLGIKSWRNISNVANAHPTRIVGGYYWRWADGPEPVTIDISVLNQVRTSRSSKAGRPVIQIDPITTDTLRVWPTQTQAATALGVSASGISRAIKHNTMFAGHYWTKQ